MNLDERKNRVLQAIIHDYVETAEPVGSRALVRKYRLGVSPATVRNEMQDLEHLGLLEQPHASAGRVPSDRGYRYYVDELMERSELTDDERAAIGRAFERRLGELDQLLHLAARLLADHTRQVSLVSAPDPGQGSIRSIQLVPYVPGRALLVVVTDVGVLGNQVVEVPSEITLWELSEVSQAMTAELRGRPLHALSATTMGHLRRELYRYRHLVEETFDHLTATAPRLERVVISGTAHILMQPEFRDGAKVGQVVQALEDPQVLEEVLPESAASARADRVEPDDRVSVVIGEELRLRELQECSLITATYRIGGQILGRVGVVGPRRMDYARVIRLVEEIRQHFAEAAERAFGGD